MSWCLLLPGFSLILSFFGPLVILKCSSLGSHCQAPRVWFVVAAFSPSLEGLDTQRLKTTSNQTTSELFYLILYISLA